MHSNHPAVGDSCPPCASLTRRRRHRCRHAEGTIPFEPYGEGVNAYVYFVSNTLGGPPQQLPYVTPDQVRGTDLGATPWRYTDVTEDVVVETDRGGDGVCSASLT